MKGSLAIGRSHDHVHCVGGSLGPLGCVQRLPYPISEEALLSAVLSATVVLAADVSTPAASEIFLLLSPDGSLSATCACVLLCS